jgi:DNA polymerase family A
VRSLHSTLNFIVTSAEAIVCKRWLVQVYDELCARFRYGWDGDVVIPLWIHDEIACCCRSEIASEVGEIMVRHAKAAGEFYGLRVPLDADFKVGRNWANEPVENQAPIVDTVLGSDEIDDDDAPIVDEAPPQPVHQIDWAALLEQDFPRAPQARLQRKSPPLQRTPPPPQRASPSPQRPSLHLRCLRRTSR